MIEGVRLGLSGVARAGRAGKGSHAPGFAAPFHDDIEAPSIAAPSRLAGLDSLLALQEAGIDEAGDREARQRGEHQLAGLDRLQIALLSPEGIVAEDLARLATLNRSTAHVIDPRLREVLQAIGLRARIELAKRASPQHAGKL